LANRLFGRKCGIDAVTVLLITLIFVTVVAWNISQGKQAIIWSFRILPPVAAVVVAWWLHRIRSAPERIPDLLRQVAHRYFEKGGLCFIPVAERTASGLCTLNIYFQNRYAGHASTRIQMLPPLRTLRLKRHELPAICANIECPGGAFGVVRIPLAIAARYQGKRMSFEIAADTKYRAGRGELLRWREGVRVGATRELKTGHQLASGLVMLLLGHFHTSRPAVVTIALPRDVAENGSEPGAGATEILWSLDAPTANAVSSGGRAAA
jgi:hypothetical protein